MSPSAPPAAPAAALLLALLAAPALADPPADDDDIETIEIRARRAQRDARDATAAVDTLRPDDDPRPLTDLGALVERAPGVRIVRWGDPGREQTVQMRGAGGHQVAVMLDDVPLCSGRGAAVDLGGLPPSMLAAVEVVRGAAGAAYGSGAQGGVLRLRTRSLDGAVADVRARGGSFGLAQGEAVVGGGGRALDGLAFVGASRADGDFDYADAQGRPATRLNNHHRRLSGLLRGRLRLGGVEATALAHGQWAERGEPGTDQFPDFDARTERARGFVALGATGDGLDGRLAWRTGGWWMQRRSNYSDPTGPLAVVPAEASDRTVGARAAAEWHGFADHRPELAVEARWDEASSATPSVERGEARPGGSATAAWNWDGLDDLRLAAIARLDALRGRDALVVPKLGAVYAPLDDGWRLELRANGGRLFRDPGFDELYVRGPGIRGNPDLRPEDGWGADVGMVVGWRGPVEVELDAAVFAQRFDRLILFVPTDAYTIEAVDDHGAAVDGVELALRLGWGPLRFDGTWLGQDARFTAPLDAPLPDRPSHRLVGQLAAALGPLELFATGRWHGALAADRFGSRTRPGHGVLDGGLAARLPWGFTARAEVRNALDEGAFDLLQRPLPGRGVVFELGWTDR